MLKLFGNSAFISTLHTTATDDSDFDLAYWAASIDNTTSTTYYAKVAVYNATEEMEFSITFKGLESSASATLKALTALYRYSYNEIGVIVTTRTTSTLTTDGG